MVTRPVRRSATVILALLLALLLTGVGPQAAAPQADPQGNNTLRLAPPAFVRSAHAQEGGVTRDAAAPEATPAGFPEDEAGIAAYFKSANPINLNNVKSVFRVIESQTAEYIIGSVPVTNYPDTEDVHVYVHKDGWFLAYYLAADPVGKIFNWRQYHDTGRTKITTKLEDTLALVTSTAGVSFLPGATHYHFRYPSATHLMLITEWARGGTDSFQVKLPGEFVYWEMSWSFGAEQDHANYSLNDVEITRTLSGISAWETKQGKLTPAQMLTDQYHTVAVESAWRSPYAYAGLALLYTVP